MAIWSGLQHGKRQRLYVMASRSGAQPRTGQRYVLWQVGMVHSLEQDNVYVLWQVGLVHSLEKDKVYVLCQIGLVHGLEQDKVYAFWQVGMLHSL